MDLAQCDVVTTRIINENQELLCFLLLDPIAQQASIQWDSQMLLRWTDLVYGSSKVGHGLLHFGLAHLFVPQNGLVVQQLRAAPHLLSAQFPASRHSLVKFHPGQKVLEDSNLQDRIPSVAL